MLARRSNVDKRPDAGKGLSVPVATPWALVGPDGWVRVFPLPVADSTTVAPLTRVPLESFAVTVIVDEPLPATIEVGEAATVDCAADTPPPPLPAALISTPNAPALLFDHVASIVLSFTAHSANRSPVVLSPEGCSSIRVNPLPAVATGVLLAIPNTP